MNRTTAKFVSLKSAAIALVLAAATLSTSARAADIFRSQRDSATANWQLWQQSGTTFVGIGGSQVTDQGGTQAYGYISILQYDNEWNPVLSLSAFTDAPQSFKISQGLGEATLSFTVEGYEWVSGTVVPVTVNLNWTANGALIRGSNTYTSTEPGGTTSYHNDYRYRPAQASGSVLMGGGYGHMVLSPSQQGEIRTEQQSSVFRPY